MYWLLHIYRSNPVWYSGNLADITKLVHFLPQFYGIKLPEHLQQVSFTLLKVSNNHWQVWPCRCLQKTTVSVQTVIHLKIGSFKITYISVSAKYIGPTNNQAIPNHISIILLTDSSYYFVINEHCTQRHTVSPTQQHDWKETVKLTLF